MTKVSEDEVLLPWRALTAFRSGRRPASQAAILACLLAGIALLTVGLVLDILTLACVGAVMTQFSRAALGYLCARIRRSRLSRPAARRGYPGR